MVDLAVLPGFIAVILLFLIPPGPDMVYMLAVGLEGGRQAAVKAILGIGTGMSIYATAVVIGVARVVESHPMVFDVIRLSGAAYLVWLAFVTIRDARRVTKDPCATATGRWYMRGMLISLTNPKIILFFISVLPQFMGGAQSSGMQLAMLGAVNVMTEVVLYGSIGLLAGYLHSRVHRTGKTGLVLNYIAAIVYAVLSGLILADILRQ